MNDFQGHYFKRGLDLDSDKRIVQPDSITDSNDAEFMSFDAGKQVSVEPYKSSVICYEIPDVIKQSQIDRLFYDGNKTYEYKIFILNGPTLDISFTNSDGTYNSYVAAFEAQLLSLYGTTYTVNFSFVTQNDYFTFSLILADGTILNYTINYTINTLKSNVYTIQDGIESTTMLPITSETIQTIEVVFSIGVENNCQEVGLVNRENGIYTYTRILRTNKLAWSQTQVFDIRIENQANRYFGIYYTNNDSKPSVIYVIQDYTTDSALKWNTINFGNDTNGFYTLNNLASQIALQITNNTMRVQLSNQLQGGGGLLSGGYRYAIRCGIHGTGNTTEWCYLSNLIPVFKTSTNSPSAWSRIQGDISGETTGKINILQVNGAQSSIFNFIELAAVYYAGGATSAYIVKRIYISSDDFTITHTGLETVLSTLDVAALPPVQELIEKGRDLEIKKNRLNIADITISISDDRFADISLVNEGNIEIQTGIESLESVGRLNSIAGFGSYAQPIKDTPYAGIDTGYFEFTNIIQNNGDQFVSTMPPVTSAFNAFFSIAGFTKVTLSGSLSVKTTQQGNLRILLVKNSTTTIVTSPLIDVTETVRIIDIGHVFNNVNSFYVANATPGDYFSLQFIWNHSIATDLVVLSTSYIQWGNGDLTGVTDFSDTRVGEYQLPENVANKIGYMINESYPFYFKYHLDNGYITAPYFGGIHNFSGQDLTNYSASNDLSVYAYKAIINNIPIATLRTLGVKGISVWRGVCNPTILGTGIIIQADNVSNNNYVSGYYAGIPNFNGQYHTQDPNGNVRRNYGLFISADTRVSNPQYGQGDQLISFGNPYVLKASGTTSKVITDTTLIPISCRGSFAEYMGKTADSTVYYDLTDSQYVVYKGTGSAIGTEQYKPYLLSGFGCAVSAQAIAYNTTTPINGNVANDNGVQIGQYYQPKIDQYDQNSIFVVPTGTFIEITDTTPDILSGIEVFGGDTYTQKSIVKLLYGVNDRVDNALVRYSFVTYYGQNKINTQLFYTDKTADPNTWNLGADGAITKYLFPTEVSLINPEEQFNYDKGYIAPNIINKDTPFNSEFQVNKDFISRIVYSEEKPTGSIFDFYRVFLPLNFKDLDNKYGPIMALYDIEDIMLAIQPNAVSVLPYQSDVAISGSGGAQVYLGSGGVYAQREHIVSAYGSTIKTCTVRGKNLNGNYSAYWYSDLFQKFLRYGAGDGVKILSDLNYVRSWLLNNTAFISQEYDLILGFDVNRQSVFITSRAINKNAVKWTPGIYHQGDVVYYYTITGTQNTNTFSFVPNIYIATVTTTSSPYNSNDWEYIDPQSEEGVSYYNYWTLIFNEKFNAFTGFSTILPNRYFSYLGLLLAPRPAYPFNNVYEIYSSLSGTYLNFFEGQSGEFIIESTTNKNGFEAKRCIATSIQVGNNHDTNFNPTLEIYNEYQNTTVQGSQMELRRGNLVSAVRDDIHGNPLISEWNSYRISTPNFIRILGIITTFYDKRREPTQ